MLTTNGGMQYEDRRERRNVVVGLSITPASGIPNHPISNRLNPLNRIFRGRLGFTSPLANSGLLVRPAWFGLAWIAYARFFRLSRPRGDHAVGSSIAVCKSQQIYIDEYIRLCIVNRIN